jgi:hypothetical protein
MKTFILEVPAGTKVEIREYDDCHTITMYEKPEPIFEHDLLLPESDIQKTLASKAIPCSNDLVED